MPKSKISVTANFIKTKDKINIAYLEDILDEFDKYLSSKTDNEKAWQAFFEKHAWIFSHLFPYEVIFSEREAYVGGKTVQNKDGKIVDFLYQNGFQDNFALIEIKTHKKDILKGKAYRGTDVFAMSDDLSGGINQCLDQKDNFIKDFGKDLKPIDPKCILVIGKKEDLSKDQLKCFELLRHNQKAVDIVTFDELRSKKRIMESKELRHTSFSLTIMSSGCCFPEGKSIRRKCYSPIFNMIMNEKLILFIIAMMCFQACQTSTQSQTYFVTDYGAVGDSTTFNTEAIQAAIDAAAEEGGGKVIVPPGKYITGSIALKSNIVFEVMITFPMKKRISMEGRNKEGT